jgi:hypothetical protein
MNGGNVILAGELEGRIQGILSWQLLSKLSAGSRPIQSPLTIAVEHTTNFSLCS